MTTGTYLRKNKPIALIYFSLVLLITTILNIFYSEFFYDHLIVFPTDIQHPSLWYRFFSYSFYINGLIYWLYFAGILVFAGYILKNKISDNSIWTIIITSALFGAIVYAVIAQNDSVPNPLAGPALMTSGLSMCAAITVIRKFNRSVTFERVFVGVFILYLFLNDYSSGAYLMAQASALITGLFFGFLLPKNYP